MSSSSVSPSPAALAVNRNNSPSILVQELAASLTTREQQVPEAFLVRNGYPPVADSADSDSLWMSDLLIDFSLLSAPYTDPSAIDELRKLRSAICSWGCFQVLNHGVEKELLDRALEASREFFALPLEERQKCAGTVPFSGYGSDNKMAANRLLTWNDRLYLRDNTASSWPENPPQFREIFGNYITNLSNMPEILMKAMARSLDLDDDDDCFINQHGVNGSFTGRVNIYPRCPIPDRVLGLKPHGDGSTFSILLQDKEGLQVMKDEQWFRVPVIPGALFINVGDLMEIMSNGVIKSAYHRVVPNPEYERVTLNMLYNPRYDRVIKPVDELVSVERPQAYKEMTIMKYGEVVSRRFLPGQRTLNAFKL